MATQDGLVKVESSDKMWSTGGGNGKPLQHSCLENPRNSVKKQKDMTLEDEPPRLKGVQYATGEEQRAITNNFIKKEADGPKQKWCLFVDVSGSESKVQCCKKQYYIGIWNGRSVNQGVPWKETYTDLVLVAESCPTLCDPMDCSPPGFSAHGILQEIILERVAISFSRRSSQLRDQTRVSCIAGRFFTVWVTGEVHDKPRQHIRKQRSFCRQRSV